MKSLNNTLRFICITFFAFLCCTPRLCAQNWAWAKAGGSTGDDAPHGMATDAAGNVYVAGYYHYSAATFGSITLPNAGSSDICLVKYSPSGAVIWARNAGGSDLDAAYGLAIDSSGDILITGYFRSSAITFGSTTLMNSGSSASRLDMFVAKYDSSGAVVWAVNTGIGTNDVTGDAITTDASGNVYVTGSYGSTTLKFGSSTTLTNLSSYPYNDGFLAKYTSSGTFVWAKNIGGTVDEAPSAVATDIAENVYVTGFFSSPTVTLGATALTNASTSTDIFLVKYSPSGNVIWTKREGATSSEKPQSLRIKGTEVYMSGVFVSSFTLGTTSLTSSGDYDAFLAKYDTTGAPVWARRAGGTGIESAACVAIDTTGNVYMTGYYFSPTMTIGSDTLIRTSSWDAYLVKYDATGSALWATSADSGACGGIVVATGNAGEVYMSGTLGSSAGYCKFDTITVTNVGGSSFFIARYNQSLPTPPLPPPTYFIAGATNTLTVCENDAITPINTLLQVTDSSVGPTDTWSLVTTPSHGTAVASYSTVATGGMLTPTGTSYMPTSGYSGPDSFKVQVSNGSSADTITIHVTVQPSSVCYAATANVYAGVTELSVFPNPAERNVSVLFATSDSREITVAIVNSIGQRVQQLRAQSNNNILLAIDEPGLYLILINERGETYSKTIIVR